jgi:hypothetical protein
MRKLSAVQQRLLSSERVLFWDELSENMKNHLTSLNDYETLPQDAERFLNDQYVKRRYS